MKIFRNKKYRQIIDKTLEDGRNSVDVVPRSELIQLQFKNEALIVENIEKISDYTRIIIERDQELVALQNSYNKMAAERDQVIIDKQKQISEFIITSEEKNKKIAELQLELNNAKGSIISSIVLGLEIEKIEEFVFEFVNSRLEPIKKVIRWEVDNLDAIYKLGADTALSVINERFTLSKKEEKKEEVKHLIAEPEDGLTEYGT